MFNDLLVFMGIETIDKPIVYIAGKIRNEPQYKRIFNQAAKSLQPNYIVIPATEVVNFLEEQNKDEATEFQIWAAIIEVIEKVESVYFLDNWVSSPGAKLEYNIAKYYGKNIVFESEIADRFGWKLKNLMKHIKSYYVLPDNWLQVREPWFVFLKKAILWTLFKDYSLQVSSIGRLLGLKIHHTTVIQQIADIDTIIEMAKKNSNLMSNEITKINAVRNVVTEFIEGNNYE